jgi:predicted ester cyclase
VSTDANKTMVAKRFQELDRGNLGVLDEMFSPEYRLNFPGAARPLDLVATKQFYSKLYTALPDLKHTIHEQVAEGDKVVTRWTAQGTHKGELLGRAPTGTRVSFSGINIYRIADGKLAESHVSWDVMGIASQLGMVDRRHLHE